MEMFDEDRAFYSMVVTGAAKKVHKGEVRNTVLRQIKNLGKGTKQLGQGIHIKQNEIEEFKAQNPGKAVKLQKQVAIMQHGVGHIQKAIRILQEYKHVTVT